MIGQTIKDLRRSKKLSQTDFAKIVGVSQTTVTAWETGKAEPSSSAITRIADYFEIQSEVLKINAYNLENNQYDTKHTKTEKKQIAAKQNKIAEVLKNISNKFAIKYKKSEAETNKEISKDKDMKLKLKDLKETNPETTSSSSSTSLF